MDLSSIVRNNSEYNKKYEYYTSLGYSEKAALVLSVFTYGGVELKKLIEDLGNDRILERLYDWVLESNGKDPMSEVRSYYAEKHRATILEDPFVGSGPGNGAGGFFWRPSWRGLWLKKECTEGPGRRCKRDGCSPGLHGKGCSCADDGRTGC